MRTVESQITSVYPSQTNFVVEATFTWDYDVTLVYYGSTTVTLKAGEHLQVDGAWFSSWWNENHSADIIRQLPGRAFRVQMRDN